MASGYNPANGKIYLNGGYRDVDDRHCPGDDLGVRPGREHVHRAGAEPTDARQAQPRGSINGKFFLVAGGRTIPDEVLVRRPRLRHREQHVDGSTVGRHADGRRTCPGGRLSLMAVVFDRRRHVYRPCDPFDGMNDVSKFDPAANTWSTGAALESRALVHLGCASAPRRRRGRPRQRDTSLAT